MGNRLAILCLVLTSFAGCTSQNHEPIAVVSVLTQHNDNMRTGANLQETALNVSNVTQSKFGKLFERPVDGDIYGQPLYVPNVEVPGKGRKNLIYVATMHNTVYAFDADGQSRDPIWSRQLGVSVPTSLFCEGAQKNIHKEIGVVSTPVISPGRQALYVVSFTIENGERRHYLHALDLVTGNEKFNGPKRIAADGFAGRVQNQRAALLLANDTIYAAFGAYGDCGPFHGWVFGFNPDTLESLPGSFNTNPITPAGNGIWQAGQGPAADAAGNIYLMVGNGTSKDLVPPLRSPADKVTLKEQAAGQPAALGIGSRMLIAWTARNAEDPEQHLKIATWRKEKDLADIQTLEDTSVDGPALTAGNGRAFLAWTANDSQHSNPVYLRYSIDLKQWRGEKIAIPGASSLSGPSLAFGNGRLFAAWTDKNKNIVVRSSADGLHWNDTDEARLPGRSTASPQLAFIDDQLFLLWSDESQTVNLAHSEDGKKFFPVATKFRSPARGSLIKEGPFWLAWMQPDGSLGLVTGRTPADLTMDETLYRDDRVQAAPTLVALNGPLYALWTAAGTGYLTIGRITEVPAFANGFLKLRPDLSIADWFTAWNTDILSRSDVDVGSAGPLLLPGTGLVVGGGKEGKLYLLQRNNLGGFCPKCGEPAGDTQIVQWFQATPKPCEISPKDCGTLRPAATFYHIHGSPVYWDGPGGPFIYVWSEAGPLRRFKFENGKFITDPVGSEATTPAMSMPGAMLSLSANGNDPATGIVWASHPTTGDASEATARGTLRAMEASTLRELWNSDKDKADMLGFVSKFAPVTVANGRVYAATFADPGVDTCQADACKAKLVVYGLK